MPASAPAASSPPLRRPAAELEALATSLFLKAGLDREKAQTTARLLVLTDMMGRWTHGLAQTAAYLDEITGGRMGTSGDPEVVRDLGSTLVWDGGYRPGLWLVDRAIDLGAGRAKEHGVFTCVIRKAHHIGCLAALAMAATDRGLYVTIASSGPHSGFVAPYGGTRALFSPNPFAIGFPATRNPVLVDICASITTVSMTREKVAAGEDFDHPWLLDHAGRPTRDPKVLEAKSGRGSLVLLGGAEAGHKGFGLALMVEALTQGLAGYGRRDKPTNWGGGVFLQLMDPAAFAGSDAFVEQMDFLLDACRDNPPIDPSRPVRIPGDQASRNLEAARRDGVPVMASTAASLKSWGDRLAVPTSILD